MPPVAAGRGTWGICPGASIGGEGAEKGLVIFEARNIQNFCELC